MSDDPGNQRYTLLCVSNDISTKSSFLFPVIRTEKTYSQNFAKTGPTEITVSFIAENRDSSQNLVVQDTLADLVTILGGRSPI